jgi:propanediol utilization protein
MLRRRSRPSRRHAGLRIPVAVSARHAHLTQATIDLLFGPGHELHRHAQLSQPGEFSAEETVTIVGPQGRLEHVRLLGPPRGSDQIEISRSDAVTLGLDARLRVSGDLHDTSGVTLEGPSACMTLPHGVILAHRHIHMSPQDAARHGVRHGEVVAVSVDSDGRDLTFGDVVVRVAPHYSVELHLDTDEGNAAGVRPGTTAVLLKSPPDNSSPRG